MLLLFHFREVLAEIRDLFRRLDRSSSKGDR